MTRMEYVKHWAKELGLHLGINSPGDGKTRYSFYVQRAGGGAERHIFTAVGIGQAEAFIEAYRECMRGRNPKKRTHRKNPGIGKAFTFHGAFNSKILAARREKEIPGSFIHKHQGKYYVLKPKKIRTNPRKGARALMLQILPHGEVRGYVQKRKYQRHQRHRKTNPTALTSIFGKAVKGWTPFSVGMPGMNPPLTKIYDKVLRVEAQKGPGHLCDAKCKRAGHRYFHDFTSKPSMYGTPDKRTIIIK